MSFFIKSKQDNASGKFSNDIKRKRKPEKISKRDLEITSSEDEAAESEVNLLGFDEEETAQEKKLRLAKICLEEIGKKERLKTDLLKHIRKCHLTVADKYTSVDQSLVKTLKCREQHKTITCLCISSDNSWIFSGSKDGVVVKWCLKEHRKLGVIPFVKTNADQVKGHTGCIYSIAISTDNKFLAVGDPSGFIQIWNPTNLNHIRTFKGHKKTVTALCIQHNSHTLYSASNDRSVRVWSLDEMAFVETLFGHQDGITSIDVLSLDHPTSAGGTDGTVRVWKVSEESQLVFNAHSGNINSVKLINDNFFISGGDDGQVTVWSCIKKKPLCSVEAAHGCDPSNLQPYWITAVAALVHTDLVASGSQDGFIRLWKVEDRCRKISQLCEIPIRGFVNALAFTSDGTKLIAGIGKDHRLGRLSTVKSAVNSVCIVPLQVKN